MVLSCSGAAVYYVVVDTSCAYFSACSCAGVLPSSFIDE